MQADYPLHAIKGVKESFDNASEASIMEYKDSRLFHFEQTNVWTEIFNSTETLSGSKQLAEHETPPITNLDEGYQVSLSNRRFGGAIELTEDDLQKAGDSTTMIDTFLQRKRNQLLVDNQNLFLTNIFEMYNQAFDVAADYLAPDGKSLIADDHTWSSGGTFDNKATSILNEAAIEAMEEYAGAFTDASNRPWPLSFDIIVVKKGSANAREAKRMFGMYGMKPTSVGDINIYEGEYTVIETPYITPANKNYWFAIASRMGNPLYVGISKMPSMNEPLPQNNESVRSNVTGYWKQGIVNMPVAFYGSNGTTS